MSKHFGCYLLLILMIAGKLNVAYPAPQTDSLKLWTVDLPYRSPLIKGHEDKIAPVKGNFVLTTMIQIKKVKEGETNEPPPPDFFLNLFQRSEKGDGLYALKNYQIIHDKTNWVFDPQFSPDGTKVLFKDGWPWDRNGTYQLYIPSTGKWILVNVPG